MGVLGNGLCFEATDSINGRSAQDRTRTAEESGIPEIIPWLNNVIEKRLLRRYLSGEMQVAFVRVGIEEMLCSLDQRNFGVFKKAYRLLQETTHRHMVSVENRQ